MKQICVYHIALYSLITVAVRQTLRPDIFQQQKSKTFVKIKIWFSQNIDAISDVDVAYTKRLMAD